MDDLSSQFLSAFNAIENWMRIQLNASEGEKFVTLQLKLAKVNYEVRLYSSTLKRFAKLRNFIAHNHSKDQPLAVPTLQSVEQIIKIRDQFLSPKLLLSVAASPVRTCHLTDPLGLSVKKMHAGVFSQLPIYDGEQCLGLLTAETIARWLASHFGGNWKAIVGEKPISEVIQHQEDPENYKCFRSISTVADGLAAFNEFSHRGKRLEAILITQSGTPSEKPLGIVTIHDVPKLRRAIQE